jgi:hypothetical protein
MFQFSFNSHLIQSAIIQTKLSANMQEEKKTPYRLHKDIELLFVLSCVMLLGIQHPVLYHRSAHICVSNPSSISSPKAMNTAI